MGMHVDLAKKKIRAIIIFQFLMLGVLALVTLPLRHNLFSLFTSVEQLLTISKNISPFQYFFIFSDFVACSLNGIILGLRIQRRQMWLTGFGYLLVGLPLMYLMAFKVGSHDPDYEYSFVQTDLG